MSGNTPLHIASSKHYAAPCVDALLGAGTTDTGGLCDINAQNFKAHDVKDYIEGHNIKAYYIEAYNIKAHNIKTHNSRAHIIRAHIIRAHSMC